MLKSTQERSVLFFRMPANVLFTMAAHFNPALILRVHVWFVCDSELQTDNSLLRKSSSRRKRGDKKRRRQHVQAAIRNNTACVEISVPHNKCIALKCTVLNNTNRRMRFGTRLKALIELKDSILMWPCSQQSRLRSTDWFSSKHNIPVKVSKYAEGVRRW